MNFIAALLKRKKAGFIPVIPDIKRISPKEGELLRGRDPVQLARELAAAGAPALSVVTEQNNFGGSCALLESVAKAVELPVLRKDFIRHVDDIKKTRDAGARAVLIICAMLPPAVLVKLYEEALRIGLEALVETHTREELLFAGQLGAKLVGINNRKISRLELDNGDVSLTQSLIDHKPEGAVLISESGIRTPAEAQAAITAGADAVLVGTALWQAGDAVKCFQSFSKGQEVKGSGRCPS